MPGFVSVMLRAVMSDDTFETCPRCRRAVEPGDPHALCPACLLETVLSDDDDPAVHGLEMLGEIFAGYELVEELGRGGMGVVYKARQTNPRRFVALKMVQGGKFARASELQRFRDEADIVGHLDHPNIVPVYEVGEHLGQQYLTMKLVEGGSLADRLKGGEPWPPKDAAGTVAKIARAVHCAHQHGILHRDLKPGNILIDREGEPHVVDFGLAKNTNLPGELSLSGKVIGTPAYMAPEQALGRSKDASTAMDIYSLGAILYHLLTGRPPFEGNTVVEVLRNVTDSEPIRPSARNRRIDRDLETICLKCLEKDPQRRYGSVEAFADDIERWTRGEPILARPVSVFERGWKWAQRRPALAALGGTVAMAILIIAILSSVMNVRLTSAKAAVENEAKKTRVEAEKNRQTSAFLLAMIERDWLSEARDADMRMFRNALANTGRRLGQLNHQPETQIEVGLTLARLYQQLGLFHEQERVSAELVQRARRHFGQNHERVAQALDLQGYALFVLNRYDESIALYRQALAIRETLFGKDHPKVSPLCIALGHALLFSGNSEEALALARRALAIEGRNPNGTSVVSDALRMIGRIAQEAGDFEEAELNLRRAVATQRRIFGDSHIFVADAMRALAAMFHVKRDFAIAETVLREALAMRQEDSGPWRHQVAIILSGIGHAQMEQGNFDAAEKNYREAATIDGKEFGLEHQFTAEHLVHLARLQARRGQLTEAHQSMQQALAIYEKTLGSNHLETVRLRVELAHLTQQLKAGLEGN